MVIINLAKHLPSYGWELTSNPDHADLEVHHAGAGKGQCDVAMIHGLYPTGDPGFSMENWHVEINSRVIESIRTAKAVTVPSQWVADILRRDMHIEPHVIGWGVNPDEWKHNYQHEGYVLWGKNRVEGVCTPTWVNQLAKASPNIPFVSTFGDKSLANLTITGTLPHEKMKYFMQRAAVYLSSTKETGDIMAREALASGVPVLGFRHGALPEFVIHGYNGFLAEINDFEGLLSGLYWVMNHRAALSKNARESVKEWTWEKTAAKIAAVYDGTLAQGQKTGNPVVSVVIPNYCYGEFVTDAIHSVMTQTLADFECIIVDDGSTDNSVEIIKKTIKRDRRFRLIEKKNSGVADTRNIGIENAMSDLVCCLDADDQMLPQFLEICVKALELDRGLGIAYAGLQINSNGQPHSFPPDYDWQRHKNRDNQIPSLAVFRKEAWERAGKYRTYRQPAEDADLYQRICAIGYRARKVTNLPLFNYRMGHTSATTIVRQGQKADPYTDPEYRYFVEGMAAGGGNYPVRNYDQPVVSIIIPVGCGHEEIVRQAIDSVESQSFLRWECLVINDTGKALDLTGYPYVKVLETSGKQGASVARNIGIEAAVGDFTVFLDSDDYLHPTFLEKAIRLYKQTGRYVYSDWYMLTKDGETKYHECPDFSPNLIFDIGYFHPITCLIPTAELKKYRFDETMETWEDIQMYMELIKGGLCGVRIPEALLTYRYTTGSLREKGASNAAVLRADILARYEEYITGGKQVMCCGLPTPPPPEITPDMELVKVVMNTVEAGKRDHYGSATGTRYRRASGDVFYARKEDVQAEPEKYQPVPDIQPEKAVKTVVPMEPIAV